MAANATATALTRERLLDAIYGAMEELLDAGIRDDMVGIAAGGLQFLITGEDGERLSDSDLREMAAHEEGLAAILWADLRASMQGFPGEEDRRAAWITCDTIASAFAKSCTGGGR